MLGVSLSPSSDLVTPEEEALCEGILPKLPYNLWQAIRFIFAIAGLCMLV